jgi:hypothetical protein
MFTRTLSTLALLVGLYTTAPAAAPPAGDREPDMLLPASTQVYVRWDGYAAHRDAYRNSALGKMLAGEMGRSLHTLWGRYSADLKVKAVGYKLLEGVPPAELRRRNELVQAGLALPPVLAQTGFVAGFEARVIPPASAVFGRIRRMVKGEAGAVESVLPYVQFTTVFPGAKNHPDVVKFLEKLAAFESKGLLEKVTVAGRTCHVVKGSPTEPGLAWWFEGKHLVVVGALGDPAPAVSSVVHSGAGVTGHRLYKALKQSRPFDVTTSRGFVDASNIVGNVRMIPFLPPMVLAALEDAGLLDIQGVRFWEGFEGEASRAAWEVDFAARQRGIYRFLVQKPLNLKELPPLPSDTYRWTAARANVSVVYDLMLTLAASTSPDAPPPSLFGGATKAFAEAKKQVQRELEDALGIKLGELFGSLGDTFVAHCSFSDGLSVLGQVVAISVKDEKTLLRTLDPLMRKIAAELGERGRFRKRSFHGAIIREIALPGNSPVTFACTLHQGWLVLALNPQPIQGFILRSSGKLPVWKPDERTARALARIPADAGLVQVVDPRTTMNFFLSAAPVGVNLFSRGLFRPDQGIERFVEVGDLPHAEAVTRHLFPNVSWTTFDGKTIRIESRESLWLPLQEIGMEMLVFLTGRL